MEWEGGEVGGGHSTGRFAAAKDGGQIEIFLRFLAPPLPPATVEATALFSHRFLEGFSPDPFFSFFRQMTDRQFDDDDEDTRTTTNDDAKNTPRFFGFPFNAVVFFV